jgi:tetratricopeptide (TPR) repeat protein
MAEESLVLRAERLLKARQYDDALGVLLEAAALTPDDPMILGNLGGVYLATRRFGEAIPWLRRSIAARPTFARAHYHLGMALQHTGDEEGAFGAFVRAAQLGPELVDAHSKVADLLWERGRRDEAVAAYVRAARAAPDTTIGRLASAKGLLVLGRTSQAEDKLRELLARDSNSGEAELVYAHLLVDAGRFDEARDHFERSIAIAPSQATAYHGIVASKRITESDRPLVDRIEARIRADDLGPRAEMTLHFAAGKAHDDLGDYARAMEHFDAANVLRRKLAPKFEPSEHEALVTRLTERYTRVLFAERASLGDPDETPLFVLGMPRSGTTLIERIVSSHPKVGGGGELAFWREMGPRWAMAEWTKLLDGADALRTDYRKLLRAIAPDALRVTDKMPFNYLWIGLLHLLFPNARFVHTRRHPVDTCLSLYTTPFGQAWGFASDRGDLVAYYRHYARLMDHWRDVVPKDRFLELDYEEVTAQPDQAARRLIAFAGLPWDDACLRPEENPDAIRTSSKWQARQPVYRSSVERWRRYEPWLGELRELL